MLRRLAASLAALALLGASSAEPSVQQQRESSAGAHAGEAPQQAAHRAPEVVRAEVSNAVIAHYTRRLAYFTAALVAVGFLSLIASVANAVFLLFANRVADRSAKAALKSADAAMAGQRAVVIASPYSAPAEGGFTFGARWDNAGNLATRRMRNHIDYQLIEGELSSDFRFPDDAPPIAKGTMLGPKGWTLGPHIPAESVITAAEVEEIRRGEKNLFFYGWARYFDGFEGTPERVTKFCYRVRAIGNRAHPFVFHPCSRHNCTDEDCNEDY